MNDLSVKDQSQTVFYKRLIQNIKHHKAITAIVVIVLLVGGGAYFKFARGTSAEVNYLTAAVEKGALVTTVSGSGQISSSNEINITSEVSSKVVTAKVKEGDTVKAGQTLVTLDAEDLSAAVFEAKANLSVAEANLKEVETGLTGADLKVAEATLKSAENALENAEGSYDITVSQQETAVETAYSNYLNAGLSAKKVYSFDTNATITLSGSYTGAELGEYQIRLLTDGAGGFNYTINGLEKDSGTFVRGTPIALGTRGLFMTFSSAGTFSPVDYWVVSIPNKLASTHLSTYNSYQTALGTQTEKVNQAQESIEDAQDALELAKLQFEQKIEPATQAEIDTAKVKVISAQVSLRSAQEAYSNTIIKAPFDGIVSTLAVEKGDEVTTGGAIATLITKQQIAEIALNEVDAATVKAGQKATLTFSAVDDLSLTGLVAQVDQVGTISSNVVNFTVKISLDTQDERIKPGMSTAVTIVTNIKQDVLMVPVSAVKTSNGESYVQVMVDGKPEARTVTTGLSSDTQTEISGDNIAEGDIIVTQTVTGSSAKTSGTSSQVRSSGGVMQSFGGGTDGPPGGF